jgi:ABC-type phosphate/phosphonate transport system substrate-binding protein
VHDLIGNLQPGIGAQLRTVATTRASPIPLFVATAPIDQNLVGKLQAAFMSAARADELKDERDMLLIADFVIPEQAPYQALQARAQAAAVYPDVW